MQDGVDAAYHCSVVGQSEHVGHARNKLLEPLHRPLHPGAGPGLDDSAGVDSPKLRRVDILVKIIRQHAVLNRLSHGLIGCPITGCCLQGELGIGGKVFVATAACIGQHRLKLLEPRRRDARLHILGHHPLRVVQHLVDDGCLTPPAAEQLHDSRAHQVLSRRPLRALAANRYTQPRCNVWVLSKQPHP